MGSLFFQPWNILLPVQKSRLFYSTDVSYEIHKDMLQAAIMHHELLRHKRF